MPQQIFMIHGGTTFDNYEDYLTYLKDYPLERILDKSGKRWKDLLPETLGDDYEVIAPSMPGNYSTKYKEWKIWMEKFLPLLHDDVILIGHSLGGLFWMKYLSDNTFPVHIKALHAVAAPFSDTEEEKLDDFNFTLDAGTVTAQCGQIFLYHSRDDEVVPYVHAEKYIEKLPSAKLMTFEDHGHFLQEDFPELVEQLR